MGKSKQAQGAAAPARASRRRFLGNAAGYGAATAAATLTGCGLGGQSGSAPAGGAGGQAALPALTLRFQAGVSSKDPFFDRGLDYVRMVAELTGGQLKIELLPAGAVVGAFDQADAVHKGILDGSYAVPAFWYGKDTALSLFGTGPAFGQDANTLLAWYEYGGGKALYEELYRDVLKLDVVAMLLGPMLCQPLGWFRKEVKAASDFKGLKYRTVGLSIDVFKNMGASVVAIPGGEIVPALERGVIDAAEFINAASDAAIGFPDVSKVCMVQSYHQPGECFEILLSRKAWNGMPELYRNVLRIAAKAASADMHWKTLDLYSRAYEEVRDKRGVRFVETPADVLQAQLKAWDKVIEEKSAANPFFGKVLESQKAFMKRVVGFQLKFQVEPDLAYAHFFGKA
jgi:TRAP-type mannitol/chloroaromatic compound transport system substrate-binding protein